MRVARIELATGVWKTPILPLNYTRILINSIIKQVFDKIAQLVLFFFTEERGLGMGRQRRLNGRMRRAMADIKRMRRGTKKLIRKTKERRGFVSEEEGQKMETHFLKEKKILSGVSVATSSFMNMVLKVDKIWQRFDGAFVPLQFKSTQRYAEEYKKKFREFLEKKFGKMPVIIVLGPGERWEDISENVLQRVNSWEGCFRFTREQVEYSKFFDYERHRYLGPSLKIRKKMFFKHLENEIQAKIKQIENTEELLELNPS